MNRGEARRELWMGWDCGFLIIFFCFVFFSLFLLTTSVAKFEGRGLVGVITWRGANTCIGKPVFFPSPQGERGGGGEEDGDKQDYRCCKSQGGSIIKCFFPLYLNPYTIHQKKSAQRGI